MATAFVLINTQLGDEKQVLEKLRTVEGVQEAYAVRGTCDIVARIKAATLEKLRDILNFHVRKMENIATTLTLMAIEEFAPS